ncbi:hypothetical protein BC938DRAFT_478670 [Jimgerdemannia flammicorona]|uniref:Uncharacterized protein n=1 Tax=Jimgerdemannia flammicorona TaxID=994334 RepID=A0A433QMH9_9FUNG|nr:hypothetical protein BC938DRAFT_478670 [Jimgerdemannia flammicorona]
MIQTCEDRRTVQTCEEYWTVPTCEECRTFWTCEEHWTIQTHEHLAFHGYLASCSGSSVPQVSGSSYSTVRRPSILRSVVYLSCGPLSIYPAVRRPSILWSVVHLSCGPSIYPVVYPAHLSCSPSNYFAAT